MVLKIHVLKYSKTYFRYYLKLRSNFFVTIISADGPQAWSILYVDCLQGIRDSYCNKVSYSTNSFLAVYIVNIDHSFCCLESKLIVYSSLYHQFLPINTR